MKYCGTCQTNKPETEFSAKGKRCRQCCTAKTKEYRMRKKANQPALPARGGRKPIPEIKLPNAPITDYKRFTQAITAELEALPNRADMQTLVGTFASRFALLCGRLMQTTVAAPIPAAVPEPEEPDQDNIEDDEPVITAPINTPVNTIANSAEKIGEGMYICFSEQQKKMTELEGEQLRIWIAHPDYAKDQWNYVNSTVDAMQRFTDMKYEPKFYRELPCYVPPVRVPTPVEEPPTHVIIDMVGKRYMLGKQADVDIIQALREPRTYSINEYIKKEFKMQQDFIKSRYLLENKLIDIIRNEQWYCEEHKQLDRRTKIFIGPCLQVFRHHEQYSNDMKDKPKILHPQTKEGFEKDGCKEIVLLD